MSNKLDIRVMFNKLDKSNDQHLDASELSILLKNVDTSFTHQHCLQIIQIFDKSNDGKISFDEFHKLIVGTDYTEEPEENNMLLELKAKKVIKTMRLRIHQEHINIKYLF